MAYKQKIIGVTVQDHEKAALSEIAASRGITASKLAKLYITKGLQSDRPSGKAQDLVDNGLCPDLEAANKLLRFLE